MVCRAAILFPTSMVSALGGYGAHDACMEGGVVEPALRLTEPESCIGLVARSRRLVSGTEPIHNPVSGFRH